MWPIATDGVVWSVCVSVHLLNTFVSPAKTAEPIEMPFGVLTQVGPKNHLLDRKADPQGEGAIMASQRHCCSRLQCCRLVSVTLHCPCEKSAHAMLPFVKIL